MTPDPLTASTSPRPARSGPGRERAEQAEARPVTGRPERFVIRAWIEAHLVAVHVLVACVVAVVPLIVFATDAPGVGDSLSVGDVVASVLAFVLLMVRRRLPLAVLAVGLIGAAWTASVDEPNVFQIVVVITLYTISSTRSRTTAWSAAVVAGATLFVVSILARPTAWYDGENVQEVLFVAIATAVGDAVRSRRAYLAAIEERAERAERTREEESRRRVVEERLRIARELHDVVAHHIAVVNVQAGVASHVLRDDPSGAEAALVHVRHGAHSVLDELATILNVLRQPDGEPDTTQPLPTLDQLDSLVESFETVGLDVERHTTGTRRPVSASLQLAAYRIIQESLTNAHRHGHGPNVVLRVDYRPDALSVEIANFVATADSQVGARSGFGITGMHERAEAAGGTLDATRTGDGRFQVHAVLPFEASAAS